MTKTGQKVEIIITTRLGFVPALVCVCVCVDRVCGCFFATDCLPRRRKRGGRRAVNNGRHERQTRSLADSSEQKGKSDGYTKDSFLIGDRNNRQTGQQDTKKYIERERLQAMCFPSFKKIDKKKKKKKKVKWVSIFVCVCVSRLLNPTVNVYAWKSSLSIRHFGPS